jgi:methionine synthase II (cobalamin-independent)
MIKVCQSLSFTYVPMLQIPAFPTTTIGSFPQTAAIRKARADLKAGRASAAEHERLMDCFISEVIGVQEGLGIDVLVHGEPERSDMCAPTRWCCCSCSCCCLHMSRSF